MAEYVKDFENGYKIQKVFAADVYGNIYDSKRDVEERYPVGIPLDGYVVVAEATGLVPDGCNHWNETVDAAVSDYEEHVLPVLNKLPENCFWFALTDETCISVWYAPDTHDGDQFQMKLEKIAEDGSMGAHCEVICDESYGTADLSFEALCDTLREVCDEDAVGMSGSGMEDFISALASEILATYGLEISAMNAKNEPDLSGFMHEDAENLSTEASVTVIKFAYTDTLTFSPQLK